MIAFVLNFINRHFCNREEKVQETLIINIMEVNKMKKISKCLLAMSLALAMAFCLSGTSLTQTQVQAATYELESTTDALAPASVMSVGPFLYTGNIANNTGWSSLYSMSVSGTVVFGVGLNASSGSCVAVEVFKNGSSLGIKSYNLVNTTWAKFTYGTLTPGNTYTYRYRFVSGSGYFALYLGDINTF